MMLPAVILLTLVTVVTARDSCEVYTDYLCGDVCIDQAAKCHCGEDIVHGWDRDRKSFCCLPPSDRQQCYAKGREAFKIKNKKCKIFHNFPGIQRHVFHLCAPPTSIQPHQPYLAPTFSRENIFSPNIDRIFKKLSFLF